MSAAYFAYVALGMVATRSVKGLSNATWTKAFHLPGQLPLHLRQPLGVRRPLQDKENEELKKKIAGLEVELEEARKDASGDNNNIGAHVCRCNIDEHGCSHAACCGRCRCEQPSFITKDIMRMAGLPTVSNSKSANTRHNSRAILRSIGRIVQFYDEDFRRTASPTRPEEPTVAPRTEARAVVPTTPLSTTPQTVAPTRTAVPTMSAARLTVVVNNRR